MADLYGTSACSPPHPPLESEDMSTFLHHLLHNPSSSSCMTSKTRFTSAPESKIPAGMFSAEDRHRSGPFEFDNRVGEGNLAVVDSSAVSFDFENSGGYFGGSDVGGVDTEVIAMRRNFQAEIDSDGYGYDSEKGAETAEAPTNSALSRSSSKRSRAAEIHNLSEKRRRSRINEKMKALQKLIPNSNKTDKASMLDEAIEYLKQLQLQVQMLSMRNGLSMHPLYVPGGHQPMQLLPIGTTGFDENNVMLSTNVGTGSINAAQEPSSIRTAMDISSHCTPSNLPINVPTLPNFSNPETPFGFEPEIEPYRPFILSRPSKDFGVEETMPGLQLDKSRSGKINSSSGVS